MKTKISDAFRNGKTFIPYIMAGDPDLETTGKNILALQQGGAGAIEIGIPFSDPVAEGEVIQEANLRAFRGGTTLDSVFDMVNSLKGQIKIPILFMTYVNLLFNYGYDCFFEKCSETGVSGVILPDLPFEEAGEAEVFAEKHGLEVVYLLAPTSENRIKMISEKARGFIYLISSLGVTGVRNEITTDLRSIVSEIRKYTATPVAVGFGISTREQAAEFCEYADGFIVGSALVKIIAQYGRNAPEKLKEFAEKLCSF